LYDNSSRQRISPPNRKIGEFTCKKKAKVVSLIGGESKLEQGMEINTGCDILVATPGRLIDCLESGYFGLERCVFYILDEADRMTEKFEEQVITILEMSKAKQRIMMMFSATMPPAVERLAKTYLRNPAYVYIGEQGLAVKNITQIIEFIPRGCDSEQELNYKKGKLKTLLEEGPKPPIIVFANKVKRCDTIIKYVRSLGWKAIALHSKKSQQDRNNALEDFKEGKFGILVATDVASRGVHVDGITHVINFDMPDSIVTYTHRIGRTGRMGLKGRATSILTNDDGDIMADLKEMLVKTGNNVPTDLANHPRVKGMRNVF
jgi:ATP-dependent RNA helicase DDX23/PRP28